MRIEPTIDFEKLLEMDGSLPFTPHVITPHVSSDVDEQPIAPAPVPRQRKRHDDGISVMEHSTSGIMRGIVDAALFVETRWTCVCGRSWRKAGRHTGTLRTCRGCGARYFLRLVPIR